TLELAECFNAGDRGVSRMGWSNEYYDEKIWEIAGAAPWETFDRRLEADAAKDALAAALAAKDRSEATCVARALYRLDVLAEADARERELDAATRAQLGFEALRDLDALRRLGSVSVVAWRSPRRSARASRRSTSAARSPGAPRWSAAERTPPRTRRASTTSRPSTSSSSPPPTRRRTRTPWRRACPSRSTTSSSRPRRPSSSASRTGRGSSTTSACAASRRSSATSSRATRSAPAGRRTSSPDERRAEDHRRLRH